jgi:hypothetical protein
MVVGRVLPLGVGRVSDAADLRISFWGWGDEAQMVVIDVELRVNSNFPLRRKLSIHTLVASVNCLNIIRLSEN